MKPNITVAEVQEKHYNLKQNIKELIENFNNSTGFYVESIDLKYLNTIDNQRSDLIIDMTSVLDNAPNI